MKTIPALTLWTDNYRPLHDRWISSLPHGFDPIVKHMDVFGCKSFGFRTMFWYQCIKQKINFFTEQMFLLQDEIIIMCSDSDIIFLKKGNTLQELAEKKFAMNPELDIWIMQESTQDAVNGGFYFVKNSKKVRGYLKDAMHSCDNNLPFADQTFFNLTIKNRMKYQYIPNDYVVWGNHIFDVNKSLFHHAVCCHSVSEKLEQQKLIMNKINKSKRLFKK